MLTSFAMHKDKVELIVQTKTKLMVFTIHQCLERGKKCSLSLNGEIIYIGSSIEIPDIFWKKLGNFKTYIKLKKIVQIIPLQIEIYSYLNSQDLSEKCQRKAWWELKSMLTKVTIPVKEQG